MAVGKRYVSMSLRNWDPRAWLFVVKAVEVVLLLLCVRMRRHINQIVQEYLR